MSFWNNLASFILKRRFFVIGVVLAITLLLATQAKYAKFSFTEANLLPEDHPENLAYNKFLDIFGEEGNLVLLAVKDSTFFTPKKFNAWNKLLKSLDSLPHTSLCVSVNDAKDLRANREKRKFEVVPIFKNAPVTDAEIQAVKQKIFGDLPFYDNLLYNDKGTIQTAIYLKKDIVNSPKRVDFVTNYLQPAIDRYSKDYNIDVRISGMSYVRTLNSQNIIDEMGVFVLGALGITALIFFFFFRSIRATLITLSVVGIGVIWAFGFIGLFRFEITVLSALIPPLIIVIGVPNAVFLINKYQQEVRKHGNQALSLHRVITKIGNAILMTNITTASGFATFIFVKSQLLREFGILASVNIICIFILALFIIPVLYSFFPLPKEKHLKHLDKKWVRSIVVNMEQLVRKRRSFIYLVTLFVVVLSVIGLSKIGVSGSLLEDMPKNKKFYKDIKFFEQEFGGILPLEILIDTKKKNGVKKLSTLKRIEKLNNTILEFEELSKPMSINSLVKFSKQAFYNGDPSFYKLPTAQEQGHLFAYTKNSGASSDRLTNFVDKTGRYARITTFMKDVGTDKMELIQSKLEEVIKKQFPESKYKVSLTGKALVFIKGTNYLINNLFISLSLAIMLIAIFMAWMFRSSLMIVISLLPNMLPLLITAGLMGYLSIPLKPSTILVFSIAFGISVDDSIHFLAKYRQELLVNNWKIRPAVYAALRETGVSMFYTSIVLFFGFLVFTISSFGGTIALGSLVSVTLLLAMVANLLLLPSLLITFSEKNSLQNKQKNIK